jgi:EAL domain-containing protein (putative c-di-GMP-specific phosphodiesterase class I)
MVNSAPNLEKLQQIRQMGARVAIDDFGTGFCSFSYLLQYPVDRLKIDQSFVMKAVTEPNAATVVRTIVAMSHNLGIKVIAEGVETPEHLRFLVERKCDEAQGYYFSRPVTAAGFAEMTASIQRLFDERKLLEEMRGTSAADGPADFGDDHTDHSDHREHQDQTTPLQQYQGKQIVM